MRRNPEGNMNCEKEQKGDSLVTVVSRYSLVEIGEIGIQLRGI